MSSGIAFTISIAPRTIARPAFCAALTEGVRELYARCGVHE